MTRCQNHSCGASAQSNLCAICVKYLHDGLVEIPWLWGQLEVTRTRQDRLTTGEVGHRPHHVSALNVGAMQLAREIDDELAVWTTKVCTRARLVEPRCAVPLRAVWMARHINTLAADVKVGDFYKVVIGWVGDPDSPSSPGAVITAINRHERRFAGPCPTVMTHDREGKPVECGIMLYALVGQESVSCGRCKQDIDVKKNRLKASVDRDLLPDFLLLEAMAVLGENIGRARLYGWIRSGRLHHRGYLHQGEIVPAKVRKLDKQVFSLSQCRQLRWQDEAKAEEAAFADEADTPAVLAC